MLCVKCGTNNPQESKYCSECGTKLAVPVEHRAVEDDPGAFYCTRHPKVVTRLRCGRCETPVCPKCSVYSPAGVRCRDCARNRVAVRPMGLLHSAGSIADPSSDTGRRVWYLVLIAFIISIFRGRNS